MTSQVKLLPISNDLNRSVSIDFHQYRSYAIEINRFLSISTILIDCLRSQSISMDLVRSRSPTISFGFDPSTNHSREKIDADRLTPIDIG